MRPTSRRLDIIFWGLDGFQLGKVIKWKQLSWWSAEDELRVSQSEGRSCSVVWWWHWITVYSALRHSCKLKKRNFQRLLQGSAEYSWADRGGPALDMKHSCTPLQSHIDTLPYILLTVVSKAPLRSLPQEAVVLILLFSRGAARINRNEASYRSFNNAHWKEEDSTQPPVCTETKAPIKGLKKRCKFSLVLL